MLFSVLNFAALTALLFGCVESLSIRTPPPPLQVYEQPVCPGSGYVWVPGYWAYGRDGYYWVPGAWELAPRVGWLWTPGYWGWTDGEYVWHPGYWAKDVGFYGGIDYGNGYAGSGYEGGYWRDNDFYYNSAVSNVDESVVNHHIYNKPVANKSGAATASYNGGSGGVIASPTKQELVTAKAARAGMPIQKRPTATIAKSNNAKPGINFKYKIDPGYSQMDQIKNQNYQITKDTVRFFFCSGGFADKFIYKLRQNSNTLEIEENHVPETLLKPKKLFCVFCTIFGLKPGKYFIKTTNGTQEIDIK
jgi:WXXGXW repeat (2 copies)